MTKIPNLFVIMNEKGISQKQLSEAINTSQGNISDWKSGRAAPTIDKLPLIADYLDVSLDHLLGRADYSAKPASELTKNDQELLTMYRELTDDQQHTILITIKAMIADNDEQALEKKKDV